MNFRNITIANKYEITEYLEKNIKNLSNNQKSDIYHIIEDAPFYFYKRKKHVSNIWLRLSIILLPFIWLILFIFFPFTFIISGTWGYGKTFNFILNWMDKIKVV